ncbi:leucine-rich repeat domain-containing protein [Enhygromyxa salina]|uniref:leucine-rich repeat domain-containing protein n=1 Tax=Enhygromyxa salina TaxID=215803 RepID=UPI0015E5C7D1|nr:leucine-rich repeat domain-containing protein [Enhygromyxa salina]
MLLSLVVAGMPTSRRVCTLLSGALVLSLASCEGRPLPSPGDGINFGEAGDGDGSGEGEGEGDGDGDGDGDSTGSAGCVAVVDELVITDDTAPESVACVEEVLGDLTIGPTTQLVNLEVLANLREVGGTIYVFGNLSLTSLAGLEQLESVDWLHIRRNHNLSDLHGLGGLVWAEQITVSNNAGMTSLAGLPTGLAPLVLEVAGNDLLPSLDGLPSFESPDHGGAIHVEIEDNPALIDLGGLSDCCAAQPASVVIDGNDALTDLDGLEGFERLDTLRLHDNLGLVDLDGLDNLSEVQTLDVQYDHCVPGTAASLVDFGGAESLTEVDVLQIQWVDSLTSLAGLEGVGGLSKLLVRNNAGLAWGEVLALESQTAPGLVDTCGGVDGPECAAEPCPMF